MLLAKSKAKNCFLAISNQAPCVRGSSICSGKPEVGLAMALATMAVITNGGIKEWCIGDEGCKQSFI
jgi:hypothetical protein